MPQAVSQHMPFFLGTAASRTRFCTLFMRVRFPEKVLPRMSLREEHPRQAMRRGSNAMKEILSFFCARYSSGFFPTEAI